MSISPIAPPQPVAAGPRPLPPADRAGTLAVVTLAGLGVWLLVPGLWISLTRVPEAGRESPDQAQIELAPHERVVVGVVAGLCVTATLIAGNLVLRRDGLRSLGLAPADIPRGILVGVAAALIIVPLAFGAAVLTDWLWRMIGLEHPGAHDMLRILGQTEQPRLRWMIFASALLVAPLFEELLFRGHVQTAIACALVSFKLSDAPAEPANRPDVWNRWGPRWGAIVATSLIFALVHAELWMMPPIFFLSLCLGYVYERSGNLWAAIAVHALFNAANVALFLLAGSH